MELSSQWLRIDDIKTRSAVVKYFENNRILWKVYFYTNQRMLTHRYNFLAEISCVHHLHAFGKNNRLTFFICCN